MEGLLSDSVQEHGLALARRYWNELQDGCRTFWKLTSDKEYLESDLSRRGMRTLVWPLFWSHNLYLDIVFSGKSDFFGTDDKLMCVFALDVAMLLVGCVAAFAPTRTLLPDAFYSLSAVLYYVCYMMVSPQSAGFSIMIILINVASGLHPVGNAVVAIIAALASVTAAPSSWFAFPTAVFATAMCGAKDTKCAMQFADLQRQQHAVTHLLEGAGDGSCVVCTEDGKIVSSTTKLAESFGTQEPPVGASFTDFVSSADEGRMEELYDKAASNQTLDTTLVTCLTDVFEYEAKVIPYAASAKTVSLCIQIQGERRFRDRVQVRARGQPRNEDFDDQVSRMSAFSGSAGNAGRRRAPAPSVASLTYSQTTRSAASSVSEPTRARSAMQAVGSAVSVLPPLPTLTSGQESPRSIPESSSSAVGEDASMPEAPGSSSQAAANAVSHGALVPEFQVASAAVIHEGITWLIKHWNIQVPSSGVCCEFHACLRQISHAALELARKRPCDASWTRQPPWKCPFCSTHNRAWVARCYVCYLQRPGSSREPAPESDALQPSYVKL